MPYVYAFDHKHRRPPMEHEGPARRQGRQSGRDDLGARAAGARLASPSPPTPAGPTWTAAGPRAVDAEVATQVGSLEKAMGKKLGDAGDPLLVSVRSGAKFSMPGMMDTVLNLGLNDESVKGLADADQRRALRLRLLPPVHLDVRPHRARTSTAPCSTSRSTRPRSEPASTTDAEVPAAALADLVDEYKKVVRSATGGRRSRRIPQDQLRGAIEAVFRSWNGARALAYRVRERIPHDLGTAVNVQAMVFGNRDDNSGTGVGFTRDPATGAQGSLRRLPRQRPGRGRRRRDPQHRAPGRAQGSVPRDLQGADGHLRPARSPLPGHVRHRVHHRAGQALDAADPGRQAHRSGPP